MKRRPRPSLSPEMSSTQSMRPASRPWATWTWIRRAKASLLRHGQSWCPLLWAKSRGKEPDFSLRWILRQPANSWKISTFSAWTRMPLILHLWRGRLKRFDYWWMQPASSLKACQTRWLERVSLQAWVLAEATVSKSGAVARDAKSNQARLKCWSSRGPKTRMSSYTLARLRLPSDTRKGQLSKWFSL